MRPGVVRLPSQPLALGAVALVSYAAAVELFYLAFQLGDVAATPGTLFPAAGVSLALLLGSRHSRWPVLVGAIWAAGVLVDLRHGVSFHDSAIWGVAHTVEPMVAAFLIRRLAVPRERRNLGSVRNLIVFMGSGVLAGPAVGALIAAPTAPADDPTAQIAFWVGWWVGDGIGVLVVAPALLVLSDRRRAPQSWGAPWLALVTLLSIATLGPDRLVEGGQGVYLLLPVLVVVAFMAGAWTTALAVLIVGFVANAATLWGYGPFVQPGSLLIGRVNAQIFVGTMAFSALFVNVLSANLIRRDQAERMLREQARTDELTGIGNRRMLFERLAEFHSKGALEGHDRIALLLLDLDGFKQVNDAWGHAAGDQVLRTTADRLRRSIRSDEIVVRLGGDEFLVCLTRSSSSQEVRAVADRLAAIIAEPIEAVGQLLTVGASIGVADGLWEDFDVDEFLRRADKEMYSLKQGPDPRPASSRRPPSLSRDAADPQPS